MFYKVTVTNLLLSVASFYTVTFVDAALIFAPICLRESLESLYKTQAFVHNYLCFFLRLNGLLCFMVWLGKTIQAYFLI